MSYKSLPMILLSLLLLLSVHSLIYSPLLTAFGESKVMVSPNCGPEEGFSLNIDGSNFTPNSSVSWVRFDANLKPKFNGYFATDRTGGFKEITYVDHLEPGKYTLFFFSDSDINYMYDSEKSIYQMPISIPCTSN